MNNAIGLITKYTGGKKKKVSDKVIKQSPVIAEKKKAKKLFGM